MSMFHRPAAPGRVARTGIVGLVILALFSFSVPARADGGANNGGDFGDAPDNTNHLGFAMNAFHHSPLSGPVANYPTVFDPSQTGPQGPWHRNPGARSWLGWTGVSREANADQGFDAEGFNNITPRDNHFGTADADDREEVLATATIDLPNCRKTSFDYVVTGAPGVPKHTDFVNAWIDLNRNGTWGDLLQCKDANGVLIQVSEWVVINQPVDVAPGASTFTTPQFYTAHAGTIEDTWMRITVAEEQASSAAKDGSGPATGYATGETTDMLLRKSAGPAAAQQSLQPASGGGGTYRPDVAYYYGY